MRRLAVLAAPLLVVVLSLGAGAARAHKYYAVQTRISFNADTGAIEIVHRFFAHDLERALEIRTGAAISFSEPEAAEAAAGPLIGDSFAVTADGAPLRLIFVGLEVDGEFVWAYYEATAANPPQRLEVSNRLLTDLFPEQINTVTADFCGLVRSANFVRGEDSAVLEFGHVNGRDGCGPPPHE